MAKKQNNTYMNWLKTNLITLLFIASGILFAWAALNARVTAIEAKVSLYPSQDWFELKFNTIDERFNDIEESLNGKVDK